MNKSSSSSLRLWRLLLLGWLWLWYCFLLLSTTTSISTTEAYPVVAHIDEESERCFRFNVRTHGHDEAHIVVLVLPNEEQFRVAAASISTTDTQDVAAVASHEELEQWYVQQLYELSQRKDYRQGLPRNIAGEAPEHFVRTQNAFQEEMGDQTKSYREAPLSVTLSSNPAGGATESVGKTIHPNVFQLKYFVPLVINHVKKRLRVLGDVSGIAGAFKGALLGRNAKDARREQREQENLEGYGICFKNTDTEHAMHVLFEISLDSDPFTDPQLISGSSKDQSISKPKTDFDKQKHLSPLERSLDQSISAANAVLREMKYMEKREQRMRLTADNINARVRYFSYLSIGALLVITYVQVGYLKRYFHKKKLL